MLSLILSILHNVGKKPRDGFSSHISKYRRWMRMKISKNVHSIGIKQKIAVAISVKLFFATFLGKGGGKRTNRDQKEG